MARKATIRDVAVAAEVSVTTVSRYLNGAMRLPAETMRRIDDAVAVLRYTPNPLARSLSRGKSETIGLVIPDIANPFFARLAAAVEATAAARGYGVLLCVTLNDIDREIDYIRRIESKYVDGILFCTNHPDDGRLLKALQDVPCFVLVDEDITGADVPGVFAENRQGAREATTHLIAAGHRQIAMLSGPKNLLSAEERRLGFLDAIREAGPGHDAVAVFDCAYTVEAGEAAAEELLRRHPETTAVFTGSDELFLGLLKIFRRQGIRIGDELSVVTCDDVEPLALFQPAITALRQDVTLMGQHALDLLIAAIMRMPMPARQIRVPMELVRRDSVRPPRQQALLR